MSTRNHAPSRDEFVEKDYSSSRNQRYNKSSHNLTWRRDPFANAKDHTKRSPVFVHPPANFVFSDPAVRQPYRFRRQESPLYVPGPDYSQSGHGAYRASSYGHGSHVYGSHGIGANYPHGPSDHYRTSNGSRDPNHFSYGVRDPYPSSYGYNNHYPPLHSSRDYYPPSHGSRDYYPPSHGSRDYYPHSRGSKAHLPLQGIGVSNQPSYGIRTPGHLSNSRGVTAGDVPSHGLGVHDLPSNETGVIVPSPKFPAVFLRGLPENCKEAEIFQFFGGLDVVDVFLVFINKKFSRKAYVVFSNAVAADYALQREKRELGDTPVEISTCRRHDYYDAIAAAMNPGVDLGYPGEINDNHVIVESEFHEHRDAQPENLLDKDQGKPIRHILKARSPCFVDKTVVLDIFGGCNLCEDRVHNVFHPDGKHTGEVLLEFISQEDANKAMSKNKTMIESHPIEIIPYLEGLQIKNTEYRQASGFHSRVDNSTNEDLTEPDKCSNGKLESYNDKQHKVNAQILKLVNVPPSADMYDIIEFFGEFNLTLDRLQVVCRRDGIATGEVYVEFDSVEDAKKAISKDKMVILTECVELFPSSLGEASGAMSRS